MDTFTYLRIIVMLVVSFIFVIFFVGLTSLSFRKCTLHLSNGMWSLPQEGATYRMLEAVEMRSGPDVHSSVVGEARREA